MFSRAKVLAIHHVQEEPPGAVSEALVAAWLEVALVRAGTTASAIAEGARIHGAELRSLGLGIFGRFARIAQGG